MIRKVMKDDSVKFLWSVTIKSENAVRRKHLEFSRDFATKNADKWKCDEAIRWDL